MNSYWERKIIYQKKNPNLDNQLPYKCKWLPTKWVRQVRTRHNQPPVFHMNVNFDCEAVRIERRFLWRIHDSLKLLSSLVKCYFPVLHSCCMYKAMWNPGNICAVFTTLNCNNCLLNTRNLQSKELMNRAVALTCWASILNHTTSALFEVLNCSYVSTRLQVASLRRPLLSKIACVTSIQNLTLAYKAGKCLFR